MIDYNAYEEYKKNERILNGEGLVPLPHSLNFHNHYQEVVPGVIKEISVYAFADFGIDYTEAVEIFSNNKKIATLYSTEHKEKVKCNCRNCGAPVYGYKCEYCGTAY